MTMTRRLACLFAAYFLAGVAVLAATPVRAEQLAVAQYGVTAGGWPYTIALDRGFFREEGLAITGIISSQGGGTSLRNMLAGDVVYGEANPGAIVVANQQGAGFKIISDNTISVADLVWVARPGSPVRTINDLRGRTIGYTNPRSTTQALAFLMLQAAHLRQDEVQLVRTGGFGEGLAAVQSGLLDVTPVGEPLLAEWRSRVQIVVDGRDVLPVLDNVVGLTTEEGARRHGDFLRAVLRARRKAVQFLYANPEESAAIVARSHNLALDVVRSAVRNLVEFRQQGFPYFSEGRFNVEGMRRMVDVQRMIGALDGEVDLTPMIDMSFLPADLQTPYTNPPQQ
jgi:NitT/TauT family transport system substrate-binding protein